MSFQPLCYFPEWQWRSSLWIGLFSSWSSTNQRGPFCSWASSIIPLKKRIRLLPLCPTTAGHQKTTFQNQDFVDMNDTDALPLSTRFHSLCCCHAIFVCMFYLLKDIYSVKVRFCFFLGECWKVMDSTHIFRQKSFN